MVIQFFKKIMEKICSWLIFYCCALFFELCNGYSINLEDAVSDQHTQLLTGIVGVLLTICSLVLVIGCLCCQRRKEFKVFQNSPVVESVSSEGIDPGHVNPVANGEFTIFSPLSPSHFNNNVFHEQIFERLLDTSNVNGRSHTDLKNSFSDTENDFPRVKLKYVKELGTGKYGKVVEGFAQCLENNVEMWKPVVIRILDSSSTNEERLRFLEDASLYKYGGHSNVLSVIGRCLETLPLLLIQEYCQGDLKSYLKKMSSATDPSGINYTLLWCSQLTSALRFLHGYQLIHPDIASRNCQLNSSLNLKLGDYSLGIYKYPSDYYQNIPLRWCDPDCLIFEKHLLKIKKISLKNNIWSLGVTLWEMCECSQPYLNLSNEDILQLMKFNNKLNKPSRSSAWMNNMYEIMQTCWSDLKIRPHIEEVEMLISQLVQTCYGSRNVEKKSPTFSEDFDEKWKMLSPKNTVNVDINSDSVSIEMGEDYNVNTSKPLSPSLNNLHGSLDNLLGKCEKSDFTILRNNSESCSISGSESFEEDATLDNQHPKGIFININSGSETEDENWRDKVENGTYTEKVRVKSKSITDLMILTHVDYLESESETLFPSINYKVNYKTAKNLPNKFNIPYMSFGSEGNLLSVQDNIPDTTKVSDELKKFGEEYSYSSVVPEKCGSKQEMSSKKNNVIDIKSYHTGEKTNILLELNIQPQVLNFYNVAVNNLHYDNSNNNISCNTKCNHEILNMVENCCPVTYYTDPQLSDSKEELCDSSLSVLPDNNPVVENESHLDLVLKEIDSQIIFHDENQVIRKDSNCQKNLINIFDMDERNGQFLDNSKLIVEQSVLKVRPTLDLEQLTCVKNSQLVEKRPEKYSKTLFKLIQNGEIQTLRFISAQIPYLLFKMIPINFRIENFSSVKLLDIVIEPYEKVIYISSPNAPGNFNSIALNANINQILHNVSNVGPKTIILSHRSDGDLMKKELSSEYPISTGPVDVRIDFGESIVIDNSERNESKNLTYSIETWDHFLEKVLDEQDLSDVFDNSVNQSRSMSFLKEGNPNNKLENELCHFTSTPTKSTLLSKCTEQDSFARVPNFSNTENNANRDSNTFTKEEFDVLNINIEGTDGDSWERNEGWYLHPQIKEDVSGEMEISSSSGDSYVGFGIDDELMSAIRDELIRKLPHAQGTSSELVADDNEWDRQDREEVFLRYNNIYNTSLPPIPEESLNEGDSDLDKPKGQCEDDSDWSAHCEATLDTESLSSHTLEIPKHCHTLSESSCCSNDTLFNLEELNFAPVEVEKHLEQTSLAINKISISNEPLQECFPISSDNQLPDLNATFVIESEYSNSSAILSCLEKYTDTTDFLFRERMHCESRDLKLEQEVVHHPNGLSNEEVFNESIENGVLNRSPIPGVSEKKDSEINATLRKNELISQEQDQKSEESECFIDDYVENIYNNVNIDYSQYVDMENAKNSFEYDSSRKEADYIKIIDNNPNTDENSMYDMLADIRFSGPTDSQLMSTSFSESNTCDEKEWDSGSDSRSSSSGEFIWKDGEREESLKALRTVHRDIEDTKSIEIAENPFVESDISSTFSDDEDRETPEFIPSAWDKFAMPIKSALRSPEKTLNNKKTNKKQKVWFKKQKYHCIYEYPKEPESPVSQKEIRWQNELKTFQDWEFENEPCLFDLDDSDVNLYFPRKPKGLSNSLNLYQLTDVSDFMSGLTGVDEKFFISSSTRPFDMDSSSSSQFFPGSSNWVNVENATPDSGVEDNTIVNSFISSSEISSGSRSIPSLKQLASECIKDKQINLSKSDDILGGLRHTRNKLKLELPSTSSAFTIGKMFAVDNNNPEPMPKENPTFTTFGKSRFLVQHIVTPNEINNRNVSFEALPYKPLNHVSKESLNKDNDKFNNVSHKNSTNMDSFKIGMETVKGEASLLDSADEDSGIESSTLEKKLNT